MAPVESPTMASFPQSRSPRPNENPGKYETVKSRGQLVVALNAKPREYDPNSCPPLQCVTLLPPQDSTAYIIERILLPPNEIAHDGKPRPRRMTYIIGWRDLPAATLLVPAMDVLDYVSPRELENWESALEEELKDDRAKLEEEKKNTKLVTGKRKRGRPPANAHIESAVRAELETDEDSKSRLVGGALSLSTPQKQHLKDFEGLSGDDESPSRQIERELYDGAATDQAEWNGDVEVLEYPEQGVGNNGSSAEGEPKPAYMSLGDVENSVPAGLQQTGSSNAAAASTSNAPPATKSTKAPWSRTRTFGEPSQRGIPASNPHVMSFTPAGVGAARMTRRLSSQEADSEDSSVTHSLTSMQKFSKTSTPPFLPVTSTSKQKRPWSKKPPKPVSGQEPVDVDGEEQWVVERLEDDALYDVEGIGFVRYFKVRWEGTWPPEQNPSWEPEDNIPPSMVRNYFKRGKRKKPKPLGADQKERTKLARRPWAPVKQYSSVNEAVAGHGDINSIAMPGEGDEDFGIDTQVGEEDDSKKIFVNEAQKIGGQSRSPWHGPRAGILGVLGGV